MTRISFTTLGCKTNHYDTGVMAKVCAAAGFEVVAHGESADVHVINTCTVTESADAQGRNLVRRVIRDNPDAIVIVCGCSSQVDGVRYKNIAGVRHVLGVRSEAKLLEVLGGKDLIGSRALMQDRARAFLKIQDGCDNRCAYCIVSFARGPSRSAPIDDVRNEADALSAAGHREIILTGVHVGRYGRDLNPRTSLPKLISDLSGSVKNCRIRVSSLDPDEIDDETVYAISTPAVCRHVHLSLQSGCDEVLEMMGRTPGAARYLKTIESLTVRIPGVAVGADIITGFPGETDEYFKKTRNFVEQAPLAYLQVFPYSRRPGTDAESMKDQIPVSVRKERAKKLLEISAAKRAAFYQSQIGKTLAAIVVTKASDKKGNLKAVSDNYVPILVPAGRLKYREIYNVEVMRSDKDKAYGNHA